MEKKTIGKFISVLRRAQGMTQRELGDMLYVSDKTVSRWERDECTPDLSLIPVIADIFGITADELLRGERNSSGTGATPSYESSVVSEMPPEMLEAARQAAARQKKKSDRQWTAMLYRRMTVYRNLSYISIGLGLLGLVGAVIANLGFTRGLVGFCIAAVFVLAGVICQLCFAANARMPVDEDEEGLDRLSALQEHNSRVTRVAVKVMLLHLWVVAFCLPIAPYSHYGLTIGFWLWEGGLCVAIAFFLAWVAYVFIVRRSLVFHGFLRDETPDEKTLRSAWYRSIRKHLAVFLPITFVLCIGCGISEALNPWHFVSPREFGDYGSFRTFMEEEALNPQDYMEYEGGGVIRYESVHVDVNKEEIYGSEGEDGDGKEEAETSYADRFPEGSNTVEDAEGNVLCEYPWITGYHVEFSFGDSDDGLPVMVYTAYDLSRGRAILGSIQTVLLLLIVADAAACVILLIRRRVKLYRRA